MEGIRSKAATVLAGKMKDVGHKAGEPKEETSEKNKKFYPTCYLSEKELPILKGKKMDDVFVVKVEFRVSGTSSRNDEPDEYTLEIRKIGGDGSEEKG